VTVFSDAETDYILHPSTSIDYETDTPCQAWFKIFQSAAKLPVDFQAKFMADMMRRRDFNPSILHSGDAGTI